MHLLGSCFSFVVFLDKSNKIQFFEVLKIAIIYLAHVFIPQSIARFFHFSGINVFPGNFHRFATAVGHHIGNSF